MLILKSLVREHKHGYAIAESIAAASEDALRVEEAALNCSLAPAGVEGTARVPVGPFRKQPPGQILSSDRGWTKGAGIRDGTMDPHERGHRASHGNGLMRFHEFKLRWRALFHRRQFEQEVDDELAFHLAMRREKLSEDGMENSAARSAAHARFGNRARTGEILREMRGWGWLERLWQDVHFGLRQLRLNPGFTSAAILPTGSGDRLCRRDSHFDGCRTVPPDGRKGPGSRSRGLFVFTRDQPLSFSTPIPIFATSTLSGPGGFRSGLSSSSGEHSAGSRCGVHEHRARYRRLLPRRGDCPGAGRPLIPEDDRPGAAPVALASYTLWESRYQSSASVLGSGDLDEWIIVHHRRRDAARLSGNAAGLERRTFFLGAAYSVRPAVPGRPRLSEPPRKSNADDAGAAAARRQRDPVASGAGRHCIADSRDPRAGQGYRLMALPAAEARFSPPTARPRSDFCGCCWRLLWRLWPSLVSTWPTCCWPARRRVTTR